MTEWNGPSLPATWAVGARPVFVGRREEMAHLRDAWSLACSGARQVVVIAGEAGIGKSRVIAELGTELSQRHAVVVLHGGCVSAMGTPYQPFVEPMDALAQAIGSGELAGDLDTDSDLRVVDLLRIITGGGTRGAHTGGPAGEPTFTRALFRACATAVVAAAADRPVLLVLEDLHWAGDTALQLLLYLVEHTAAGRLLIVATMRDTRQEQSAALVATMARLYRVEGVRRLDLNGLTTEAIIDFLVLQAGVIPARARAPGARLRDLTGGNPFLLREVWRELVRHGGLRALDEQELRVPGSVLDSVTHRLAGLPVAYRRIIELAAIIGDEFDLALLIGVTGRDRTITGDDSGIRTFAAVDAATAIGLVEPVHRRDGVVRFPHGLTRQAVLDQLPEYQRASDNAAVARVLEESFPAAEHLVQRLAHHFASAAALGFADKAVRYLSAAAEAAEAGLAHFEAGRMFERAALLARRPQERDGLRLNAARSYLRASRYRAAKQLNEQVCASASGSIRLRAAIGFEAASWRSGEPGERSVELLTGAMAQVRIDESDPVHIWAVAALGRAHGFAGDRATSIELGERAIVLARRLGNDRILAITLQIALQTAVPPAAMIDKLSRARELTSLSERIPDLRHLGPAAYHRAAIHYTQGEPAEMVAAQENLARTARVTGQPFWEWQSNCLTVAMQFLRADFRGAMASIDRGGELARRFEPGHAPDGPMGLQSFMVRRESGDLGMARTLVRGDEDLAAYWLPGLLALYHELGLREPAQRAMDALRQDGLARHRVSATWPAVLSFLCDTATWLGDADAAVALRPLLLEYAGLNLMGGEFLAMIGSADRHLGALESLLGIGTADQRFDIAERMDARMGSPVHLATTLAARVTHLRRWGAPADEIARQTARTRALSRRHGLARVDLLLDRAAQLSGDGDRPDHLTARENQVLRLIGHGYSNRRIARTLVISENTAANHVRSILAKTGAANRTQAAMYASTRGLLGGNDSPSANRVQ